MALPGTLLDPLEGSMALPPAQHRSDPLEGSMALPSSHRNPAFVYLGTNDLTLGTEPCFCM